MRYQLQSKTIRRAIRYAAAVACCLLAVGVVAQLALAAVTVDGNVFLSPDAGLQDGQPYTGLYADNPFTTQNEGIPTNGNTIETGRAFGDQVTFEGRTDNNNTPGIPGDDMNVNFSILVGRSAPGYMEIAGGTGGTDLRDMDLVIGDAAIISNLPQRGTGIVQIRGLGTLYNNNPNILPWFPPPFDPDNPTSPSNVPRPTGVGYDMWVGRAGNGTLEISQGGRAEIQDAVIVGSAFASVGTLTIDGIGSLLQSGGFQAATNDNLIHYMIVGALGSGTMSITNGGQSFNVSRAFTNGGGDDFIGAVVGSNEAFNGITAPGAGGQGTVYVDGLASKWTVGGILQIGGFHNSLNTTGSDPDIDGNDAAYSSSVGRGTLNVTNGALVSIVTPPLDPTQPNPPEPLDMLIGRFGSVQLEGGGRIELLGVFNNTDPQNPTQELQRGSVINDGVISGDGRITSLQFRNRVLGEVRVGAGEVLLIDATGNYNEPDNDPLPDEPEYPLSNYGLIEVIGTETQRAEIEFLRSPGVPTPPLDPIRPFLNLPLLDTPPFPGNGRTGGEIVAQDSIMRFTSNINNRHKVSFTGGDNEVTGNFTNEGTVFIGGNGTTVTFVDEFINLGGILDIGPNVSLVMFIDDVTLGGAGALSITFGGRPDTQSVSHISAAETFLLDGTLNASLFAPNGGLPQFSPQPGDQFEIISAAGGLFGDFATVNLPGCLPGNVCFVGFPDYNLDAYFIRTFSTAGAVGADFDGSGLVDELDLQIWRQNLGGVGPIGDANGDGIVDGRDFLIWQMQVGGPGMGAGSGSGSSFGGGTGTVPEPTCIALAACGSLLALALRRRSR